MNERLDSFRRRRGVAAIGAATIDASSPTIESIDVAGVGVVARHRGQRGGDLAQRRGRGVVGHVAPAFTERIGPSSTAPQFVQRSTSYSYSPI